MEEDHSWMYSRTIPGIMGISSEFQLERSFPLSFFDVMEHIMVHLPYEARKKIKNKARIEGSICNAYLVEEAATFYSHYFQPHVSTKARDTPRNDEGDQLRDGESGLSICDRQGRAYDKTTTRYLDDKEYKATTNYILLNCDEVEPYLLRYTTELRMLFPSLTENNVQTRNSDEFSMWFREKMEKPVNASNNECLKSLSWGPSKRMKSCHGYFTLVHELGKLESADIHGRSNEEDVEKGSDEEKEEEELELGNLFVSLIVTFKNCLIFYITYGTWSKKRTPSAAASTSVEISSTPVETASTLASIPLGTSLSLAAASTPPRMSAPLVAASTSPVTLTPFLELPYSSLAPTSTTSASSCVGMSLMPTPSSSAHLTAPAPSSAPSPARPSEGVVDSCILILPTGDRIVVYLLFFVPRDS
ncbi:hypothetical protein M9H77_35899 [Catharanthus roseus]|uniref:Uncharacterized protein n=1 Tax=Catharanthus roseus TaxID=4058 RepID=A0ACB9ZQB4_CATRO|nr:hypothetical protein M9H77_35899 [Catharanthus roseus]